MKGKKASTGVNVGGSSILVIFVLLCLTTFATLSLVSANADYKLSQKAARSVTEYYAADAKAQEVLAFVDDCLQKSPASPQSLLAKSEVPLTVNGDVISYSVPVNENQALQVTLRTSAAGAKRFALEQWKVVNTADWKPNEEALNLWGGNEDIAIFGE